MSEISKRALVSTVLAAGLALSACGEQAAEFKGGVTAEQLAAADSLAGQLALNALDFISKNGKNFTANRDGTAHATITQIDSRGTESQTMGVAISPTDTGSQLNVSINGSFTDNSAHRSASWGAGLTMTNNNPAFAAADSEHMDTAMHNMVHDPNTHVLDATSTNDLYSYVVTVNPDAKTSTVTWSQNPTYDGRLATAPIDTGEFFGDQVSNAALLIDQATRGDS